MFYVGRIFIIGCVSSMLTYHSHSSFVTVPKDGHQLASSAYGRLENPSIGFGLGIINFVMEILHTVATRPGFSPQHNSMLALG